MAKGNRKQSGDGNNADGVSRDELDWESIDWAYHENVVRRLQERIVKATEEGNRDKMHDLRRLLTRSRSAKLLAVKRVTENDGAKTPGVDKIVWTHRRSKEMAVTQLDPRGYRPLPLRRVYIPKSNRSMRPLSIPTMLDRAMQALYLLALDPIAETIADPNSYGFRKGRSCADAIEQCFNLLRRGQERWIFEGDIKGCFDHISHEWLLEHIPMERSILRKWLHCGFLDKNVFAATTEGTPQGGIISPVLANLTLDGLERRLREIFPRLGPGSTNAKKASVNFVRYADDFVITASSKELLETRVRPLVVEFLRERGLELSEEKTKITRLKDGFDFLGQNVRSFGNKTIIRPSKKSIASFLTKIKQVIKAYQQASAVDLVRKLNPMIKGWANYHRHACSKKTFSYVDNQIFRWLTSWSQRRHRNKGRCWIVDKYFAVHGTRRWCFFGDDKDQKGGTERVWLRHAARTPIIRHDKVHSSAHPYKLAWQEYWRCRQRRRHSCHAGEESDAAYQLASGFLGASPRPIWGVTEA
ncbi:MAG TPA: group II intron reverse transcriptase/maturase [Armatimonadota bacterium]|jgi:RNA-directed DNA polymerase